MMSKRTIKISPCLLIAFSCGILTVYSSSLSPRTKWLEPSKFMWAVKGVLNVQRPGKPIQTIPFQKKFSSEHSLKRGMNAVIEVPSAGGSKAKNVTRYEALSTNKHENEPWLDIWKRDTAKEPRYWNVRKTKMWNIITTTTTYINTNNTNTTTTTTNNINTNKTTTSTTTNNNNTVSGRKNVTVLPAINIPSGKMKDLKTLTLNASNATKKIVKRAAPNIPASSTSGGNTIAKNKKLPNKNMFGIGGDLSIMTEINNDASPVIKSEIKFVVPTRQTTTQHQKTISRVDHPKPASKRSNVSPNVKTVKVEQTGHDKIKHHHQQHPTSQIDDGESEAYQTLTSKKQRIRKKSLDKIGNIPIMNASAKLFSGPDIVPHKRSKVDLSNRLGFVTSARPFSGNSGLGKPNRQTSENMSDDDLLNIPLNPKSLRQHSTQHYKIHYEDDDTPDNLKTTMGFYKRINSPKSRRTLSTVESHDQHGLSDHLTKPLSDEIIPSDSDHTDSKYNHGDVVEAFESDNGEMPEKESSSSADFTGATLPEKHQEGEHDDSSNDDFENGVGIANDLTHKHQKAINNGRQAHIEEAEAIPDEPHTLRLKTADEDRHIENRNPTGVRSPNEQSLSDSVHPAEKEFESESLSDPNDNNHALTPPDEYSNGTSINNVNPANAVEARQHNDVVNFEDELTMSTGLPDHSPKDNIMPPHPSGTAYHKSLSSLDSVSPSIKKTIPLSDELRHGTHDHDDRATEHILLEDKYPDHKYQGVKNPAKFENERSNPDNDVQSALTQSEMNQDEVTKHSPQEYNNNNADPQNAKYAQIVKRKDTLAAGPVSGPGEIPAKIMPPKEFNSPSFLLEPTALSPSPHQTHPHDILHNKMLRYKNEKVNTDEHDQNFEKVNTDEHDQHFEKDNTDENDQNYENEDVKNTKHKMAPSHPALSDESENMAPVKTLAQDGLQPADDNSNERVHLDAPTQHGRQNDLKGNGGQYKSFINKFSKAIEEDLKTSIINGNSPGGKPLIKQELKLRRIPRNADPYKRPGHINEATFTHSTQPGPMWKRTERHADIYDDKPEIQLADGIKSTFY